LALQCPRMPERRVAFVAAPSAQSLAGFLTGFALDRVARP
jgi:hypothetical protein